MDLSEITALGIVIAAAFFLIRRLISKKKGKNCCDRGCKPPSD